MDIEALKRMYVEKTLTTRQISAETGIPHRTVVRYLNKAGVQMRWKGAKPVTQLRDGEWLRTEYIDKRKSTTVIGNEIGCSNHVVATWLKRHGIEARPTGREEGHSFSSSESARTNMSLAKRGKYTGDANPNWRGGIRKSNPDRSRYPYKQWVKAVKDRDGWKCTKCGSTDRLQAHHIKRWQSFPKLRYELSNGLTLCQACHEVVHRRTFEYLWEKHAKMSTSAPASVMAEA